MSLLLATTSSNCNASFNDAADKNHYVNLPRNAKKNCDIFIFAQDIDCVYSLYEAVLKSIHIRVLEIFAQNIG